MPERQQMTFVIRADGSVEESVSGMEGPQCESLTEGLERKLGEVIHREHTADYYGDVHGSDEVSLQADA